MENALEILSHRRIWASVFGLISILVRIAGVDIDLDVNGLADATVTVFVSLSDFMTVALPLLSVLKPKQ